MYYNIFVPNNELSNLKITLASLIGTLHLNRNAVWRRLRVPDRTLGPASIR